MLNNIPMRSLHFTVVISLAFAVCFAQERPSDTGRKCPAGTFDTGNYCRRCAKGTVSSGRNNFWCTKCPPSRFPTFDQSKCQLCPAGSFLKSPTKCEICTSSEYSSKPNSRKCTKCPPATTTFNGNATSVSQCKSCGPGGYINNYGFPYVADCRGCAPGFFGPRPNTCVVCPRGTSSSDFGSSSCEVCPVGTRALHDVGEVLRYGGCKKCDEGTFNPKPKSDTCKKCPPGSKTHTSGTACIAKCTKARCPGTCKPGFGIAPSSKGKNPTCVRCPAGKISFANSLTGCHVCPPTFVPNAKRSDCICPLGYGATGSECVKCRAPMVSRQGKCVCLPPNKKVFEGCECPAFMSLKNGRCIPCKPWQIKRAIAKPYDPSNKSKCSLCPLNEWYNKKVGKCLPCPPGTALPQGVPGKCRGCKNPWKDAKGKPRCDCQPGTEQKGLKCVPCKKGYYRMDGEFGCSKCEWGFFANKPGMARCKQCPPGRRYAQRYGSVQCPRKCPPYSESWSNQNTGTFGCSCLRGEKVKTNCKGGRCRAVGCGCPRGTELKNGRCVHCRKGWASMGGPQGMCKICGWNEEARRAGAWKCSKCDISSGSLSLRIGGTKCLSCPSGSFVSLAGKCEKCPVGHRVRNGKCVRCVNSVSAGGDMGYCKVCRGGKVPNKSLGACI